MHSRTAARRAAPRAPRPPRPGARTLCLLGLLACATPGPAPEAPPEAPGPSPFAVEISGLRELGPYLEADLRGRAVAPDDEARHFYFPASAACRETLRSAGEVQYRAVGTFGLLRTAERTRCSPNGIGSLAAWRDSGRNLRKQPLPQRVHAELALFARGEDVLLVRGRFPLALELRWPEPMDSVAFLPAAPECEALLAAGSATMEYRTTGERVFWLEGAAGRCPIVGLAIPVEPEATPE